MKVRVETSRCQGHTLCAMIAPESFVLDDVDGHASAGTEEVPAEYEAQVREAALSCPEQAIIVSADDGAGAQSNGARVGGMAK